MFYSEYVLAKRGALGKFWLAAHWNKKLTRAQISKSDVEEACENIIKPAAPLALRTSGHLLLGVVRIHDSKQKALMQDCGDALVKIKLAFRPGVVDLPGGSAKAPLQSITLADTTTLDLDGGDLPSMDMPDIDAGETLHVSRLEDITLQSNFNPFDDTLQDKHDIGFGDEMEPFVPSGMEIETARDRDESAMEVEVARDASGDIDMSMGLLNDTTVDAQLDDTTTGKNGEFSFDDPSRMDQSEFGMMDDPGFPVPELREDELGVVSTPKGPAERALEDLEEAEHTQVKRPKSATKARRKRKLIVDNVTEIPGDVIRRGLEPHGTDDITRTPFDEGKVTFAFDIAPNCINAFKRRILEEEGVEAMFALPMSQSWAPSVTQHYMVVNANWVEQVDEEEAVDERKEAESLEISAIEPYQEPEFEPVPQDQNEWQFEEQIVTAEDQPSLMDPTNDTTMLAEDMESRAEEDQQPSTKEIASEEFAGSGWSQRTQRMVNNLHNAFENQGNELSFDKMTNNQSRRTAAACLFEILVLKTKNYIDVEQDEPYGDVTITPSELFPDAPITEMSQLLVSA